MKFFVKSQKSLKNGLYIDYFFKNLFFIFYKNVLSNNFIYLVDKFLAEKLFYILKTFFYNFFFIVNSLKNLTFNQFLKLFVIISIQIIVIIIL
jgi:hypothetical protein